MKMWSGDPTGGTTQTDGLTAQDGFTYFDIKLAHVKITAVNPFPVIDDDGSTGVIAIFDQYDDSIIGSEDRHGSSGTKIDSSMVAF